MLPSLAIHDPTHSPAVNVILTCEARLFFSVPDSMPDLSHDLVVQTGVRVHRAVGEPSFPDRIIHIVHTCPEEQVIRSDARWVIAFVQHPQALWDRPIRQLPGDAGGLAKSALDADLHISATDGMASVLPTPVRPINLGPEPVHKWSAPVPSAMARHESLRLTSKYPQALIRTLSRRRQASASTLAESNRNLGMCYNRISHERSLPAKGHRGEESESGHTDSDSVYCTSPRSVGQA